MGIILTTRGSEYDVYSTRRHAFSQLFNEHEGSVMDENASE